MTIDREFYYGDKDQFLVMTPYGKGLITKTRASPTRKETTSSNDSDASLKAPPPMKEIRLLEWENAKSSVKKTRRSTILYSAADFDSIPAKKGDDVITPYGRGTITEFVTVRLRNKGKFDPITKEPLPETTLTKFHVTLNNWRLAGRSRVKCYLFSNQVRVVRKKTLMEMNAIERVEFALHQKKGATKAFTEKKYRQALNIYAGCIEAVRYIQHDTQSNNECRADLIEVMVTCSNNAATCCVQLEMWEEALRYSKNAFILLTALFNKRGNSRIHTILVKDNGHCDAKIFGEWRVKSHLLMARALSEKEEYNFAMEELKFGREIVAYYTKGEGSSDDAAAKNSVLRLRSQDREILKLKAQITERKKAMLKKERARAQAMFRKNEGANHVATEEKNQVEVKQTEQVSTAPIDSDNADINAANSDNNEGTGSLMSQSSLDTERRRGSFPKKRVSFASKLEEKHEFVEEEEEEEAWYDEHKEAMILLVIGGITCAAYYFGRPRK